MNNKIKTNRRYTMPFIGMFTLLIVVVMAFGTNNVKGGTPGTISATQDITVNTELASGTYLRSNDLIGDMFVVKSGATLTINSGVTIDGNKENLLFQKEPSGHKYVQGALIKVEDGGTLIVKGGILQNNADTAIKTMGGTLNIAEGSVLKNNGSFSGYEVSKQVSDGTSTYSFATGACHGAYEFDDYAGYYNSSNGWDNETFPNLLVYLDYLLNEWVDAHNALGNNPTNPAIYNVNQLQKALYEILGEIGSTPWTEDGYSWGSKFIGCYECQTAIGNPGDYERTSLPVNGAHVLVNNTVGEITYVYGATTYEQKGGAIYASANSTINITGGHIGGSGESDIEVDYAIPGKQTGKKKFINANVATDGGAIYIEGNNSKLNISGGVFVFNDVANRFTHIPDYNASTNESDKYTPIVSEEHGLGGAIYAGNGSKVVMNGGSIGSANIDNTPNANRANGGAGVNVAKGAEFTIESGFINSNDTLFGLGGGVRVDGGTFNMKGGTIKNNMAFWGVIGCKDNQNSGAGVALASTTSVFNMSGGMITQNISVHHGAGVFLNGTTNEEEFMTFNMTGGTIKHNTAVGVTASEVYVSSGNKKIFLSGGSIIHTVDKQKLDSSALWVANNTTYAANDKNFIRLDGTVLSGLIYLTQSTQYLEATANINLENQYNISLSADYVAGNKVIEVINEDLELSNSILSQVNVLTPAKRLQQGENNHIYIYEFTSADDTYFIKNYDNKEFIYGDVLPTPSICWKDLPNNQISATNVEYKYYVKNTVTGEYLESAVKNVGEYKVVVTFVDTTGGYIAEKTSVTALFKVDKKTVTIQVADFETKQGESFSPASDKVTITGLQYGETIVLAYSSKPAMDKESVDLANTYFVVGDKYDVTVSTRTVYENYSFTITAGTKVSILHSQEYNDFLDANSVILAKSLDNIMKNDLTSISNALTEYGQLKDYSSRLLIDEKASLDQRFKVASYLTTNAVVLEKVIKDMNESDRAAIVAGIEAYASIVDEAVKAALQVEKQNLDDKLAYLNYIKAQEVILSKELSDITKEDITVINNALTSLEGLSEEAKNVLVSKKENLEQKLSIATYLTKQSEILEKSTTNIVEGDREKIVEALNEIKAMTDEAVKAALQVEKQNLNDKLAYLNYIKAQEVILSKELSDITKEDITAINNALTVLEGLSEETRNALVSKKENLEQKLSIATYLTKQNEILEKTTTNIVEGDREKIVEALNEIKAMTDEAVKAALQVEKQNLDDKLAKLNYIKAQEVILSKELSDITKEDITAINNALTSLEGLSEEAKNALDQKKENLEQKLSIAIYLTKQSEILEKSTTNIVEGDREKIVEALNEIKAMTDEAVKAALQVEKQNLDDKLAKLNFVDNNKIILNKDIVLITKTDMADIKKAISEYNDLSQEAKDSFAKEKVTLDKLLIAASYLETNSTVLERNISDITQADKIIIILALEDIKNITDEDVFRALSNEKQELQEKLAKINFKENHQAIFDKEYRQITKDDLTTIKSTLNDYENLSQEIKNGMAKEKLELDRKLAIAMVDGFLLENDVEQAITIANMAREAISKATSTTSINELVANAKLDIAKAHGKENIKGLLEANDNDIIKEIVKKAQEEIDLVTLPNGESKIDIIIEKAAKQIELERVKNETKDLMKDKVNELKNSGKYDDNGRETLAKIFEESFKKVTDVTMNNMDIAKALAEVDKINEDFKQKSKDVGIVSTGGILPPDKDGNIIPDAEADYAEGYDPKKDGLFGNVNNPAGMNADITLVIKSTDRIKDFKKVAKKTEGLNKLEIKSTLDINLMQEGITFTQYSGEYRVKVLLPEDLRNYEVIKLAIVNTDGTMSVVNAKVEGKLMSFTTTTFGEFVVLTDKTTNLLWLNILFGIIILLELGWITFWHLGGKKFFDKKTAETEPTLNDNEVKVSCSSIGMIVLAASVTAPISIVEGIIICLLGGYIAYLFFHKEPQVEEEIAPVNDVEKVSIDELLFDERQASKPSVIIQEMTKGVDEQATIYQAVNNAQKQEVLLEYETLMAEYSFLKQKLDEQDTLMGYNDDLADKEFERSKAKISFSKRVFARYEYSVKAKLIQSDEEKQNRFNEIYSYLMSFKGVKCRESFKYYTFNCGRKKLARLHFRGKTICLALALTPADYSETKYSVEDISEKEKYIDVPTLFRIRSNRGMQYAKELIAIMMGDKAYELVENKRGILPYETLEQLISEGLVKVHEMIKPTIVEEEAVNIHSSISVDEAKEKMSDELARKLLQKVKNEERITGTKKGIINLDTICSYFSANEVVTINKLKEKRLISANICYIKILARGIIDRPLTIKAQDFSLEAIKMVTLTGGECVRLE